MIGSSSFFLMILSITKICLASEFGNPHALSRLILAIKHGDVHVIPDDITSADWEYIADYSDFRGNNILHYAAEYCKNRAYAKLPNAVEILLEHDARLDYANRDGVTPLHVAASKGNAFILETMLSFKNADVDIHDSEMQTPLHEAVMHNQITTSSLLLEKKANIDARDMYGKTPVHWVDFGSEDTSMLTMLLKHKPQLDIKGMFKHKKHQGWGSPLNIAKHNSCNIKNKNMILLTKATAEYLQEEIRRKDPHSSAKVQEISREIKDMEHRKDHDFKKLISYLVETMEGSQKSAISNHLFSF